MCDTELVRSSLTKIQMALDRDHLFCIDTKVIIRFELYV